MNAETPGVVLDTLLANAILAAAIDEGLVDDPVKTLSDPDPSPRYFKTRRSDRYEMDKRLAFEQLVISGRVYSPYPSPFRGSRPWQGELFDKRVIVMPPQEFRPPSELPFLSPGSLIAMLRHSTQRTWEFREIQETIDEWLKADQEYTKVFGDSEDIGSTFRVFTEVISEDAEQHGTDGPKNKVWKRNNVASGRVSPITAAFSEAATVVALARQYDALCGVPCEFGHIDTSVSGLIDTSHHQQFLEIIDEELGPIPVGKTLKSCVDQIDSDEAKAFRTKLLEWSRTLKAGEIDSLEAIRHEVRDARMDLEARSGFSRTGQWCTGIGAVLALGGTVIANPIVAGAGFIVSVVGGVTLLGERMMSIGNEWTSFVTRR